MDDDLSISSIRLSVVSYPHSILGDDRPMNLPELHDVLED